jgi:Ca2+-binding RTX toxin-like protein
VTVINGDGNDNNLFGTNQADRIFGFAGRDLLFGRAGHDYLNGGSGDDIMIGGIGNDVYVVDSIHDFVFEEFNQGKDEVRSSVNFILYDFGHTDIENLTLQGSAIIGLGNELNNVIRGTNGHNALGGYGGDDTLAGFGGDDQVNGDDGNDFINGGTGADNMVGGKGNDRFVVDNTGDVVIENAHAGIDEVLTSISFNLSLGNRVNIENLRLVGTATINGAGNASNNHIVGNGAANVLSGVGGDDGILGGNGDDHINGGSGNDVLAGGAGKDVLLGGAGDDTISGGLNPDTIATGGGLDTVIFNTGIVANVDRITDFSPAFDTIELRIANFAAVGTGVLDAGAFFKGPAAADADDRIIYDDQTGTVFYDADGLGGAAQHAFCTLQPGLALTNADFVGV